MSNNETISKKGFKGILLDTNIISQLSPLKTAPKKLIDSLSSMDDSVFISSVTVQEIKFGIEMLRLKNGGNHSNKSTALEKWLYELINEYKDRILIFDLDVALIAGDIEAEATMAGHNPGLADIYIAATAQHHNLIVYTENLKDFEPFKSVTSINPLA